MLWQFHFQRTIKTKYINIYPFLADGRLLGFVEGPRAQQALPRARGAEHVLHRAAEVPLAGPTGRPLPKSAHLHKQAGREAVSGAVAAEGQWDVSRVQDQGGGISAPILPVFKQHTYATQRYTKANL